MIYHYSFTALPDLVTDGGLDLQLVAWFETELDVVGELARDPTILGDSRNRDKAHVSDASHFGQNGTDNIVLALYSHGLGETVFHRAILLKDI